jgi:hypothetical protein
VLRDGEPLSQIEIERLYEHLGERGDYESLDVAEMAKAAARGDSFGSNLPKVRRPVYGRLIPSTIAAQSDQPEHAERFLKLWATEPVRTDVLCFLTVQKAGEWLRQHFPTERVAAIQAQVRRRLAADVDDLGADDLSKNAWLASERLAQVDLPEQLSRLVGRHGEHADELTAYFRCLTDDEVEAFKQATGLRLIDYAPLTSYAKPIRNCVR